MGHGFEGLGPDLAEHGYVIGPVLMKGARLEALRNEANRLLELTDERGGARHGLTRSDLFRELARDATFVSGLTELKGSPARPVNLTVFDKTPDANWKVPLHQDHTIPVAERRVVEGFGPWSLKEGVLHVQPPAEVLASMVALRLHLDDTSVEGGALVVVPGSHRLGRLSRDELRNTHGAVERVPCPVPAGAAMLMSPLLFHASSPAREPGRRRVLHFEYAFADLPGGLCWA